MGQITQNFYSSEFSCNCNCGYSDISLKLVDKLQKVRDEYKKPIRISSGCRCFKHNKNVGGVKNSEHTTCEAVDIECNNSKDRFKLINIMLKYFNRIGIAKTFIHVGIGLDKPQNVIWVY